MEQAGRQAGSPQRLAWDPYKQGVLSQVGEMGLQAGGEWHLGLAWVGRGQG